MHSLIHQYITYHKNAWSVSSLRSEKARLQAVLPVLQQSEDPQFVYDTVSKTKKPYAVKTLFVRLGHFYDWLIDQGYRKDNQFRQFTKQNANLFKQAYSRRTVDVTFEEAKEKIETIDDEEVRDACIALLTSGLRITELGKVTDGFVVGKRGKKRRVFTERRAVAAHRIRYALKKLGLKPHDLRKLFATRLAESDISPQDLCQIMGWNSFQTAYYYLQSSNEERLKEIVSGSLRS